MERRLHPRGGLRPRRGERGVVAGGGTRRGAGASGDRPRPVVDLLRRRCTDARVRPGATAGAGRHAADDRRRGARRPVRRRRGTPVRRRARRARRADRPGRPGRAHRRAGFAPARRATATSTSWCIRRTPRGSCCSRRCWRPNDWASTPIRPAPDAGVLADVLRAAARDRDHHLADADRDARPRVDAVGRGPHRRIVRRGPGRAPAGTRRAQALGRHDRARHRRHRRPRRLARSRACTTGSAPGSWSPPPGSSRRTVAPASPSTRRAPTCSRPGRGRPTP